MDTCGMMMTMMIKLTQDIPEILFKYTPKHPLLFWFIPWFICTRSDKQMHWTALSPTYVLLPRCTVVRNRFNKQPFPGQVSRTGYCHVVHGDCLWRLLLVSNKVWFINVPHIAQLAWHCWCSSCKDSADNASISLPGFFEVNLQLGYDFTLALF